MTGPKPLSRDFYLPSAKIVAPRLLGHYLLRRTPTGFAGGPIVETEAYLTNDPGCHAFVGETNRNRAMFGPPGRAYVYLIYGFYHCFNAVCRPATQGEAVLIRAIEPTINPDWMRANRPVEKDTALTSGPGKLCVALNIDRTHDTADLSDLNSEIFIAENPDLQSLRRRLAPRITTTRIGLTLAADWPLRFYLAGSHFVSRKIKSRT
ncbi:MAG: DNA-3-methyladenine glycosylase [Limisphaerales bacterium]